MNAHMNIANDDDANAFSIMHDNREIVFTCDANNERVTLRARNNDERMLFARAHRFARYALFHASFDDDVLTFVAHDDDASIDDTLREMIDARATYTYAYIVRACDNDASRVDEMTRSRDAFYNVVTRVTRARMTTR